MADIVTDHLHKEIVMGNLAPGDRITELHIARQFQTSQGPVREAIRRLEGMGLLNSQRFKRSTVRVITEAEIREAYEVRAALEQLAAEQCVRSGKHDPVALRRLAEDVHHWAVRGNQTRYIRANSAFHRGIVAQSGNHILLQSWDALNLEVHARARMIHAAEDDLQLNQAMHWDVLEALDQGNGARAGRLLRKHVLQFVNGRQPKAFARATTPTRREMPPR